MDFWEECISEALEDAGLTATAEQIDTIASWVEGAHENYGMAHGHDCISNPLEEELRKQKLKTQEAEERANKERENFIQNICKRRKVHPSQVEVGENGNAIIYS